MGRQPIRETVVMALIQWMRDMPEADAETAAAMLRDLHLDATPAEFIEARRRHSEGPVEHLERMPTRRQIH